MRWRTDRHSGQLSPFRRRGNGMKYMITWNERSQGSAIVYEKAQQRMLADCDDPVTVHKFCSMLPAFVFEARPIIPIEAAVRDELEVMAWRDSLKFDRERQLAIAWCERCRNPSCPGGWRMPLRRGGSASAICAPDDRRKIAATQAHIPQFPIVKLIELAHLCCCPMARDQSGRKATQVHPDP